MLNLTRTADHLADALAGLGFVIMSERSGRGLPLVAFRFPPVSSRHYDEFALAHALRSRGWVVSAYTMAPHTDRLKMLRVVVRDFSRSLCDMLLQDVKLCLGMLDETDRETIKRQEEYVRSHLTSAGRSGHAKHKAHAYKVGASERPRRPRRRADSCRILRASATRCRARRARRARRAEGQESVDRTTSRQARTHLHLRQRQAAPSSRVTSSLGDLRRLVEPLGTADSPLGSDVEPPLPRMLSSTVSASSWENARFDAP